MFMGIAWSEGRYGREARLKALGQELCLVGTVSEKPRKKVNRWFLPERVAVHGEWLSVLPE